MSSWVSDINKRNSKEEIPLLLCLKQQISDNYINNKQASGANPYKCLIMLLWLALKCSRYSLVYELIRSEEDIFEVTGIHLGQATKRKKFDLIDFLVNRRLNIVHVVLERTIRDFWNELTSSCSKFCMSRRYNQLITDDFKRICINLIRYVILLIDVVIFKLIWPYLYDEIVFHEEQALLNMFLEQCHFPSLEFSNFLCVMLNSPDVSQYLNNNTYFQGNLLKDMVTMFHIKQIERQDRLRVIYIIVQLVDVNIFDIERTYSLYQFNDEVVILLHHIKFEVYKDQHHDLNHIRRFILNLENNSLLKINKLKNLALVWKKSYCKLLNSMPGEAFNKNIRMKRKILNSAPSLYELSNFYSQKHIQKMYKIDTYNQFYIVTKKLYLPNDIKRSICFRPPLYC
ncbi:hypothetical protein ILUMI_04617 [Ignelater luminosus]|uniref:Uncharacterized protein n=1 Tax=Ignelater luminosus TaxID=2038154 RepID=A0A8K0DCI5_IGNLU|nr:hypothetical protein ILUMI_04617 [Ignelater luminosus]